MPIPTREMIDTFMSITGAAESVARQKLEEYGGNLNAAVSAHFLEMERNMTNQPVIPVPHQHNYLNPNHQSLDANRGILPLLSSIRSFRPSLLLDPNYRRSLINRIGSSSFNANTVQSPAEERWRFPLQNDHVNVPPYYPDPSIHGHVTRDSDLHLDNDIESEMVQAAIEASKREGEINQTDRQSGLSNVEEHHHQEEDVARAISLSLKTAEEDDINRAFKVEKELRCLKVNKEPGTKGSSCLQAEGSSARQQPRSHNIRHNEDTVSAEWGGISSKELDESIMLEKQLFGHNHGGVRYQNVSDRQRVNSLQPESLPRSSMRQELREQKAGTISEDKRKERNASKEPGNNHLKEFQREKLEGQVFEKELNREDSSLPPEPAVNDDNAVSVVVKMPDGTRHGRRFLKSDKLKYLFNFIDAGKGVKPGTYSLVRPYPRQAFGVSDSHLSLHELGLTGKQEALFLEFM